MHTVFIRRKLGQEPVTYPHPVAAGDPRADLRRHHLSGAGDADRATCSPGFSLAEADVLRKAVGKKDAELIKKELGKFVERADGAGPPDEASSTSSRRRSRPSAATASTSRTRSRTRSSRYQTAWLKAHYPAEFMAALLSSEIGNTDKVVQYINEARELGLEVLPPDVNESGFKFTVVGDQRIRFGLGAIRNVGRGAIESIIAARQRRAVHRARRLRGADRPPALQQAGARVADRGRRLRRRSAATAKQLLRGARPRRWARPSCCSRSARRARRRCSAKRRRAAARQRRRTPARHPAVDRGRAAGARRRRSSASSSPATRSSGSATRSSCSAPAPPPRWANGASTRSTVAAVVTGGEAADLQEDRARSTRG